MQKVHRSTYTVTFLMFVIILFSNNIYANNPGDFNQSVTTRANITEAFPEIDWITIPNPIDLTPGIIKEINCTVYAHDFNGYNDIAFVNATLWDNTSVTMASPDANMSHYSNTNCTAGLPSGLYNRTYYCTFNLSYYAYNSTNWICNATAKDSYAGAIFTNSNYNTTTINPLYALNVTSEINFGDLAIGDTSNNVTSNITNFGNQQINVSVDGYGVTDGDGLAMTCDFNNISLYTAGSANMRFSANSGDAWGAKTGLNDTPKNITGLTIPPVNDSTVGQLSTWYNTYWQLYVPAETNPYGLCTGFVIFTAWSS